MPHWIEKIKISIASVSLRNWIILGICLILLGTYLGCLPRPLFQVPYSTVVTDRNGELLGARIATDGQWRFPPCDSVPDKFARCLLTFEDQYFYYHPGVNPLAIARAAWQNLRNRHIVSGGSTLTMQTIRLSRNRPRTWGEKIIEAILATRLELRYNKDKILSLYASHAPFGGNVIGLDAAAWRYFAHPTTELSWAEAATLAVLPNAPSAIHPGRSRKSLLHKRNRLLKRLWEQGDITDTDYQLAIDEPLPAAPKPLPSIAPYLVNRISQQYPGSHTATTLDKSLQTQIEALAERHSLNFQQSDIHNLAILVIDLTTNQVIAYCGNTGYASNNTGSQVDIISAPRSTGSILKPFLYYKALQEGLILPHTLLPDVPVNINGFTPQNFNQQFEGAVPADEALARSLNIPAVNLLKTYGVPKFYHFLQEAGIHTLRYPASHYGLSLILGGAEATLWDITNMYAQMGRSLLQLPQSSCYWHLTKTPLNRIDRPVFHPGAVWQVFEALIEVNRPEEIDWKSISSIQPVAWKTGTSYGFRDAWAVGVTPHYAIGVWVGNATGEGKPGLVGARTAGPVLFDALGLLPASSRWFERPASAFVDAEICPQSGHLKSRFCPKADTLLILPTGKRTEVCPYHHPILLTADGKYRVYENCTNQESIISTSWFTLPTVWEWYYMQHHPEYQPLPPFQRSEYRNDMFLPLQFIYPTMNAHINLPRQLDGTPGSLTAELAHSHPQTTIFWHLDNTYLMQTTDFHRITIQPAPGKHSLTAVDAKGNSTSVTFYVE